MEYSASILSSDFPFPDMWFDLNLSSVILSSAVRQTASSLESFAPISLLVAGRRRLSFIGPSMSVCESNS